MVMCWLVVRVVRLMFTVALGRGIWRDEIVFASYKRARACESQARLVLELTGVSDRDRSRVSSSASGSTEYRNHFVVLGFDGSACAGPGLKFEYSGHLQPGASVPSGSIDAVAT